MASWLFGKDNSVDFKASRDIPDLSEKVILVTGGNAGLGEESVYQIAQHNPGTLYLTARNPSSADAVIARAKQTAPNANIKVIQMDLTSFASVKKAADTLLTEANRLDVLMLNAGIAFTPAGLTEDGYEVQFGVNHMGHALLTKLLLPKMLETAKTEEDADVRIVVVASESHRNAPPAIKDQKLEDLTKVEAKAPELSSTFTRYGLTKIANVLFAKSLAREYPSVKTVSLHPGVVNTTVFRGIVASHPFMEHPMKLFKYFAKTVEDGAQNQLWAGFCRDRDALTDGAYYEPVGILRQKGDKRVNDMVFDEQLEKKFWDYTEKELRDKGYGGWP